MMLQRISYLVHGEGKRSPLFAAATLLALSFGGALAPAFAQQPGQQTFASPQDAAHALFVAMESQDQQSPLRVLGPAAKEVLSSAIQRKIRTLEPALWSGTRPCTDS